MDNQAKELAAADYKARFGDTSNVIRVVANINEIIGVGTEYIVENKKIVARVENGAIVKVFPTRKG